MDWTTERVEILTLMWTEGYSGRQIAEKLGTTRNAVIGKAQRLNLRRGVERGIVVAPPPPPAPPPEPVHIDPKPQAEFKAWMCRWPTYTPGKHGLYICGHAVQPGRHYCAEHITRNYLAEVKAKRRQEPHRAGMVVLGAP